MYTKPSSSQSTGPTALQRLQSLMSERGVDIVALCPSANWRYLCDFVPVAVDRPTFLLISRDRVSAVVPDFDREEFLARTPFKDAFGWSDTRGPADAVEQAWRLVGGPKAKTVLADDTMPYLFFKALEPSLNGAGARLAGPLFMELRVIKAENEIAAIRRTSVLIEKGLARAAGQFQAGMTERDAEAVVRIALLQEGADTLDFALVQAWPNSASPHHLAGSTPIRKGEPVLIDIGISKDGYYSDITRQVSLGEPSKEYREAFALVRASQAAGVAAVKVGAPLGEVHQACLRVYQQGGQAEFFATRTGHGLGLEIHEPPSVWGGNTIPMRAGMVFTIEPGLYFPGKFGIRIEDTIVVRDKGAERLTESSRDLIVV